MLTGFMMEVVKRRYQETTLADDYATWSAGWKWTWKPRDRSGPSTALLRSKRSSVWDSQIPGFPFGEDSPRARYIKSLSTPIKEGSLSANSSSPESQSKPESEVLFTTEYFEVRPSPKGGYGAYAIQDIKAKTLVMDEECLFHGALAEIYCNYDNLTLEQRKDYNSLYYCRETDEHWKVAIFKTNRFYISDNNCGIYPKSSRFNHACGKYATCSYRIDAESQRLRVDTVREVLKGTELTISYCGSEGRSDLYQNYGFDCDCAGCPPPAEMAKKRGKKSTPVWVGGIRW